jgi:hypothetical protein
MTRNLLRRTGEALFGERWQSPLARALGVGGRTMRHWMAGDNPIPDTLHIDLFNLALQREEALREVRGDLVDT